MTMKLSLGRWLDAPPAAVWPYLTDPARMNEWSSAKVRQLEPGDGAKPGAVGELREVSIAWGKHVTRLEEVIEYADPPRTLVYRVVRMVGALPAREHRGEITLEEAGKGTHLRWDVDMTFAHTAIEALVRRVVEPQLAASLDALTRVVVGAPVAELEPAAPIEEHAALALLWADAAGVLLEQKAIAERLAKKNDPKQWFSRVYALVTENQLEACRAGRFRHPAWVLRLVLAFHRYYVGSLRGWVERGDVEAHWARAFGAMEDAARRKATPFEAAGYCVAKGAKAHIEDDLPRALAEVYREHYAEICGYARFRADYAQMGFIFRDAEERMMAEMPREGFSLFRRVVGRLPQEAKDALGKRGGFDVGGMRREAFRRGGEMAGAHSKQGGSSAASE
jgi:uncharacterized protein YndB with AHSA1/START domain